MVSEYLEEIRYISIWARAWQNQQNTVCAQRRLRSAWASAQSDQSLRCPHEGSLGPYVPIEHTAKRLIRLGGCPGWSESSLGAHAILVILSYACSFVKGLSGSQLYVPILKPVIPDWIQVCKDTCEHFTLHSCFCSRLSLGREIRGWNGCSWFHSPHCYTCDYTQRVCPLQRSREWIIQIQWISWRCLSIAFLNQSDWIPCQ